MALARAPVVVVCTFVVLLVSAASAVDYNTKCKTMSASDKDGDFFTIVPNDVAGAPTCHYFVDAGETANPKVVMEYTHAMAVSGLDYDLMVWNIDQVPGFTCINSGIGPTFSTFNGLIDATTAGTFGKVAKLSFGVTGGVYNFNFTTTGNVGIMLTPRPFSDGSWPELNRDKPYNYKVPAAQTSFVVAVTEPFDNLQQAAKTVDVTLTAAEILLTSPTSQLELATLTNIPTTTNVMAATSTAITTAGSATMRFKDFGLAKGIEQGKTTLEVHLTSLAHDFVNWKENGPWRTGTVSITSTTYPSITSTWKRFDFDGGLTVHAILGKGLWWQSATLYHQFGGDSAPSGKGFTSKDANVETQGMNAKGGGGGGMYNTVENPVVNTMLVSGPLFDEVGKYPTLDGGAKRTATMYWVRATRTSGDMYKYPEHIWMRAEYKDLTGECLSNADCNPDKDDDKVAGQVLSANGDRARMQTCMVLPSSFDINTFSTRCVECQSNLACGAGQYCHIDVGFCLDANNKRYLCDPDSNALAGICRQKDPSGSILGKPCATDTVTLWQGSGAFASKATVSEGAEGDSITGSGVCGEARYYNASYAPNSLAYKYPAGVARISLWEGKCISGMCYECTNGGTFPFEDNQKPAVQCVNGREVERRDVDFTIRTLTSNTIAGILLTAVIGIIIILIFLCFNAKQTMSKGDTYRKSLRQKYEDEQLVRAKSGLA